VLVGRRPRVQPGRAVCIDALPDRFGRTVSPPELEPTWTLDRRGRPSPAKKSHTGRRAPPTLAPYFLKQ